MQFIYFESKRVGINLDHIEEFIVTEDMTRLAINMASGAGRIFVDDEEEISYFLSIVMPEESKE